MKQLSNITVYVHVAHLKPNLIRWTVFRTEPYHWADNRLTIRRGPTLKLMKVYKKIISALIVSLPI